MDRIERQWRLGAKVTGTWGTRFGFMAGLNRNDESNRRSTTLQETSDPWTTDLHRAGFGARRRRRGRCGPWNFRFDVVRCPIKDCASQPYSKQHSFFCPQGPHFDKTSHIISHLTWKLCRNLSKDVLLNEAVALQAARVHRAEATTTCWFRRWEDDVETRSSRDVVVEVPRPWSFVHGSTSCFGLWDVSPWWWINLILGLHEKTIHNHPQMFHHNTSNAVHLSTFLKTGA